MKLTAALLIATCAVAGCVEATPPTAGKAVTSHTTSVPLVPPAQYDRAFAGKTEVIYLMRDNAWKECSGDGKLDLPKKTVGCAGVRQGVCVVYVALLREGMDTDAVIRHETAHCNGWPANHPKE